MTDYEPHAFPLRARGPLQKGPPAVVARAERKSKRKAAMDDAYRIADLRDQSRCWVTGRKTTPRAVEPGARREHHHLQPRSTHPERIADPTNIITVCGLAHALIEAGMIVVEGITTDRAIRFHWRSDVPKEKRVLVIHSRRRSQRSEEA